MNTVWVQGGSEAPCSLSAAISQQEVPVTEIDRLTRSSLCGHILRVCECVFLLSFLYTLQRHAGKVTCKFPNLKPITARPLFICRGENIRSDEVLSRALRGL